MSHTVRSWCPWALLALALSVGLCPFVTAMAIPVGLYALADIRRRPRRGRRVAITAVCVGCVLTPLTGGFAWWWQANVRDLLLDGPTAALQGVHDGTVTTLIEGFGGVPSPELDRHAGTFLHTIASRLGTLESMRQRPDQPERDAPAGAWWVGYEARFTRAAAPVDALFVLQSPEGAFVLDFRAIVITLEDGTSITWPPEARP